MLGEGAQKEGVDKTGVPADGNSAPEKRSLKTRLVELRNICINAPLLVYQKARAHLAFFFLRNKVRVLVRYGKIRRWFYGKKTHVQLKLAGWKFITPEQFVTEFPPRKGHKECSYGKGFITVQLPNRQKVLRFCRCVTDQYKKSGKKYQIIQP